MSIKKLDDFRDLGEVTEGERVQRKIFKEYRKLASHSSEEILLRTSPGLGKKHH